MTANLHAALTHHRDGLHGIGTALRADDAETALAACGRSTC